MPKKLQQAPAIDGERLLADLRELRSFGAMGTGVVRPALTLVDIEARLWLRERMIDAGLDARIDRVGNVIGKSPNGGRAVLMGSHTDTQREGGWLDGALGVIYALEIARALARGPTTTRRALDIASWIDEESRFVHYLGSRYFVRQVTERELSTAADSDGIRLSDALQALAPHAEDALQFDADRHGAYFEAHIEQGGVLEGAGRRLGVVTSIVGARQFAIEFSGQSNHAGTTPMRLRHDASMALYTAAVSLDREFRELAGIDTVWNVNEVVVMPAAASIVAATARAAVQFRDTDSRRLDEFAARLPVIAGQVAAERHVRLARCGLVFSVSPAPMHPALQDLIEAAAEARQPGSSLRMPSGAGHDAQIFSPLVPTGMLFVPSIGGISHSFNEDTSDADIVLGCQVAADAVVQMFDWLDEEEARTRQWTGQDRAS